MHNSIILNNIRLFSNHGCMNEEKKIGSEYRVDLKIELDLFIAGKSDQLEDTIDYVCLYQIVKKQMKIRSNLLENVAYRIIKEIEKKNSMIKKINLIIRKINPPINGSMESVGVQFSNY